MRGKLLSMMKSMAAFFYRVNGRASEAAEEIVMSALQNKELVRHVLKELFENQNLTVVNEHYARDFVGHNSPPSIPPNREGVKQFVQARASAFSDSRFVIEDQFAEKDRVATRISSRHIHTGEFLGVPATGKEVVITGIMIHRVENGKITDEWTESDMLGLLKQLGAMEAPAATG
ncbi:MAG: ester cyclase [Candidatus Promineifilaceae bacterium]|nr:ester cyclase [Candidatus Promineifilaceae bacterium]